jgi:site-specific recombinase XerC
MSLLFNHGRRHDLCDRNPIERVRQGAKRRTAPDILTRDEVQGLLANLRFRERTLVLLAVTTGYRRSELFASTKGWLGVRTQAISLRARLRRDVPEPNRRAVSGSQLPTMREAAKSTRARRRECLHESARPSQREGSKPFDTVLEEYRLLG